MTDKSMTYTDYEKKFEALLGKFLGENLPIAEGLKPDSLANQLSDLEEAYPRHASRYENGTGGPYRT